MRFEKIAIIGLGLIGGSMAAAFKRKQVAAKICGVDFETVTTKAQTLGLVDEIYALEDMPAGVYDADLVILAAPIADILKTIGMLAPHLKAGVLVTDVGSTKSDIMTEAKKRLPAGVYFLGGHPMAGAERGGVENADALLFENAIYVLTKAKERPFPADLQEAFVALIEGIGAKAIFMSPEQHDEIAAAVSHLPQMVAVTLMNYAARLNEADPAYLNLAAGGFRDMTRVASSPFAVWRDIITTNPSNIAAAIDEFVSELTQMRKRLTSAELAAAFTKAATSRLAIPKDTRGFIRPHFDLFVVVEDKPGVIAQIATGLADQQINIKDIEVVKVREGDAGTIRVAFESAADRVAAAELLQGRGFETRKKD